MRQRHGDVQRQCKDGATTTRRSTVRRRRRQINLVPLISIEFDLLGWDGTGWALLVSGVGKQTCVHTYLRMCMHADRYLRTYVRTLRNFMLTYIRSYFHTDVRYKQTYIHTYVHTYIDTCIHTCIHTCILTHTADLPYWLLLPFLLPSCVEGLSLSDIDKLTYSRTTCWLCHLLGSLLAYLLTSLVTSLLYAQM